MKIATSSGDFYRFCQTDEERIRELHAAGFRYIDLDMYHFTEDSPYMQDGWRKEAERLRALADSLGMKFVQAHSQGGNPLSKDEAHVDFLLRATLRSIEVCEVLGIPHTVSHAGVDKNLTKDEWFLANKAFYEKLFRSGCEIYQKKIGTALSEGERVRVCRADGSFFALGEVREYPEGSAIKSIKLFELNE